MFTYVRPATVEEPELLAVSPTAMRDLGIRQGEEETEEFKAVLAGNKILTWDEDKQEGIYPWAQCYGGWQLYATPYHEFTMTTANHRTADPGLHSLVTVAPFLSSKQRILAQSAATKSSSREQAKLHIHVSRTAKQ